MRFLIPVLLVALAYGPASTVAAADDEASVAPISMSLSLYVVDEEGESPVSALSSDRDPETFAQVLEKMQVIWDQAGIDLAVNSIARITAPADTLIALGQGDTSAFLNALFDGSIEVPGPGAINGFYVRSLGPINGLTPLGTRLFFVTDEPSVHDERVSSH
jgi:hypothetical protein